MQFKSCHIAFAVLFMLVSHFSQAQQTQFTGAISNDWFNPGNWTNNLPASGNNALIGGGVSVVIGTPLTVNFTITNFGTIAANAAVTNNGTVANSGTWTVSAAGSLKNNASFQNFGTLTISSSANFTNETGATFTNGGSFTLQTTLVNKGSFANNGTLDASTGAVQTQSAFDNNQTLTVKSLTLSAGGGVFTNNFGAVLNVSGAGATLLVSGIMTNNGTINNSGASTIGNVLTNNVTFKNLVGGSVTVNAGAQLNNSGTVENLGNFQNNGTVSNGNQFLNKGTASNASQFNNNNLLNNQAGGTFTNAAAGKIDMGFGSQIQNAGTFTNQNSISSFGTVQNDGTFSNAGTITLFSGSNFDNNSAFTNSGSLLSSDQARNDGSLTNTGTVGVNAGSVFSNFGTMLNSPGGSITVSQDLNVKPGGQLTNNGKLVVIVRMALEGSLTNNALLDLRGDLTIAAGGTLTNNELLMLAAGNLRNSGSLANAKKTLVDECSTLNNKGSINNTGGNLELRGILFQTGTLSGNAVNNKGGYVHTSTTSNAPSVCKNGTFGANVDGDVKVYASELIAFNTFDSCANIIYLANGVARPVFHCSDIGSAKSVNVVLKTRLNDSLTCVAQVTPVDQLAPVFTNCPRGVIVFTPNSSVNVNWTAPTADDNCSAVTLTSSHAPGASFPVGITGVTYTAKDALNNQNQCQFKIDVRKTAPGGACSGDNQPPVFANCPANISATASGGSKIVTWTPPGVSDNCYPVTLTSSHVQGQAFFPGSTTVTYTAKDGSNNSATCSFTVTIAAQNFCVGDNQKPAISNCPANIYAPVNATIGGAVAVWTPPTAFDLCGVTQLTSNHAPGAVFPTGTTTVSYTAKDAANNSATCSFTVTVGADPCPSDVTAPTFSGCPANLNLTTGGISATANWTAPTASDPCAPVILNATHSPGSAFPLGGTSVVYKASDKKGNTSTCSFNVVVSNTCDMDNTNPTITGCPANLTVNALSAAGAAATWPPPSASDNCGLSYFASPYLPGAVFPIGNTIVAYVAIDLKGNAATCQFTVTVNNLPPPTVVCKNFTTSLGETGLASVAPTDVFQSGTSSVGSLTLVSVVPNQFDCGDLGANSAVLTVSDGMSRTATCTTAVTVVQNPMAIISYALLVQDEIHAHKNTVNGNVGIWKAGKEARIHEGTTITGFVRSPIIDLTDGSTVSGVQTLAQAPQPPAGSFKYNTMPDPPTDVVVPDNYTGVYLLTGTNFKKVEVGKNSTAKFTASGVIFIKELKTKDADLGKQTVIQFSGNTELVVRRKVELGKRTHINWGAAHRVKFYVEEDNSLIRESCKVNASMDIRFKDLHVDDAAETSHTLLNGQFIAKKIDAKKWVDWSWSPYECTSPPPAAPLIVPDDQLVFLASPAQEKVSLQWVSNTEAKNERFVVERSSDGIEFEPLLEAPAKGIEAVETYRDADGSPQEGANFYRVRAVFEDGTSLVSEVRQVNFFLDWDDLNVFPNPSTTGVHVFKKNYVGKPAVVRLCNSLGRPVRELRFEALPAEPFYVEVSDLPGGLYWLTVNAEGFRERSRQVVVGK